MPLCLFTLVNSTYNTDDNFSSLQGPTSKFTKVKPSTLEGITDDQNVKHFVPALKLLSAVESQNGSYQRINVTDAGKASVTNEVAGHRGGVSNLIMQESVHAPAKL